MERTGCKPGYDRFLDDYPNDYPYEYCFYAIYRMLFSWVREGTCPPHGERIAVDSDGENRKDALGNAIGGVRTPFLDVPVAAYYPYSAIKRENGVIDKHGLFGHTEPFSKHKFEKLYATIANYRKRVEESAKEQAARGFLLLDDIEDCVNEAVKRAEMYYL